MTSRTLDADIRLAISDLIPLSGSSNSEYFELRARDLCEALIKTCVVHMGGVTMPAFYDLVNQCEDESGWTVVEHAMLKTPFPDVHRAAREIANKRENAAKEYSAIFGEIHKNTSFLSDRAVRETLSGSDVSMQALCKEDCTVYLISPAEYTAQLAPMTRAIVGSAMLYKQRAPQAPSVLLLIDEAATLGRFESLLRGYSYGRGMGLRMWSYWQDIGQISRNFGRDAVSGFLGSSQVRQFFGPRDYETAQLVSNMLGTETLEFDSTLEQAAARRNKTLLIRELMDGGDPLQIGINIAHQERASTNRTKQRRALMEIAEVLGMREDKQVLFISGLGLKSMLEDKYPYFTRPEMAGGYMPNPYHPPANKVRVATRFGNRWRRVVTERVPQKYAHLPQYQSGEWSYIEGYRPS